MNNEKKPTEADIAKHAVDYLLERHFEVYQEVPAGIGAVDIIAKAGPLIWAIEVKKQMSFELIAQAKRWIPYANMVSVCVPLRRGKNELIVLETLRAFGIGLIVVDPRGVVQEGRIRKWANVDEQARRHHPTVPHYVDFHTDIAAPFRRKTLPHLRNMMMEEHKTFAVAGSAATQRWTYYKRTCRDLLQMVEREPGITLRIAIQKLQHHYATDSGARATLCRLIQAEEIPGIRMEREGAELHLHPTGQPL